MPHTDTGFKVDLTQFSCFRSRIQTENRQSVFEGDNSFMDSKKSDLPGYAILDTAKGSITVELFKDSSPEVVDQFLNLW
ncbi:hypothetical protein CRYUN_Cryun01aG0197000 [Craigia yunnanensis]